MKTTVKKGLFAVALVGTYLIFVFLRQDRSVGAQTVPLSVAIRRAFEDDDRRQITAPPSLSAAPAAVVAPTAPAKFRDGTYTGNVADAFYGPYQVQAVISGGIIADVKFLQYPNDRRTSIDINTQAMPFLKQEAIQLQDFNVDIVSGASASSAAFRESLSNALDQARI